MILLFFFLPNLHVHFTQKTESEDQSRRIERGCLAGLSCVISYSPKCVSSSSFSDPLEAILTSLGVSIGEVRLLV